MPCRRRARPASPRRGRSGPDRQPAPTWPRHPARGPRGAASPCLVPRATASLPASLLAVDRELVRPAVPELVEVVVRPPALGAAHLVLERIAQPLAAARVVVATGPGGPEAGLDLDHRAAVELVGGDGARGAGAAEAGGGGGGGGGDEQIGRAGGRRG